MVVRATAIPLALLLHEDANPTPTPNPLPTLTRARTFPLALLLHEYELVQVDLARARQIAMLEHRTQPRRRPCAPRPLAEARHHLRKVGLRDHTGA